MVNFSNWSVRRLVQYCKEHEIIHTGDQGILDKVTILENIIGGKKKTVSFKKLVKKAGTLNIQYRNSTGQRTYSNKKTLSKQIEFGTDTARPHRDLDVVYFSREHEPSPKNR